MISVIVIRDVWCLESVADPGADFTHLSNHSAGVLCG